MTHQGNGLGTNVLAFEAAGLAVGGTPAVVGFFEDAVGLGHGSSILLAQSRWEGNGMESAKVRL